MNKLLTKPGYDRDVRHYVFDINNKNIKYDVGDCLAIYPENDEKEVVEFLEKIKLNPNDVAAIEKKEGATS